MSDIKGKRIAIIGGAGFIGHNMALEMKAQGADAVSYTHLTLPTTPYV